jgi:hypothetical protein
MMQVTLKLTTLLSATLALHNTEVYLPKQNQEPNLEGKFYG